MMYILNKQTSQPEKKTKVGHRCNEEISMLTTLSKIYYVLFKPQVKSKKIDHHL